MGIGIAKIVIDQYGSITDSETLDEIFQRINHRLGNLLPHDIDTLHHYIEKKIQDASLLKRLTMWSSTKQKISAKKVIKQKKLKLINKARRIKQRYIDIKHQEYVTKSTKELRQFNDKMDDLEQTKAIIKMYKEQYQQTKSKRKKVTTTKFKVVTIPITETEEDSIHRK